MKKLLLILVLAVFSNSSIAAETANCSIKIKDYNSPDLATHTINKKFQFEKKPGPIDVQRMDFGLPGTSDYMCTLAFVRRLLDLKHVKIEGHIKDFCIFYPKCLC